MQRMISKDPTLPWVIDLTMVGTEGPAPNIIVGASLNSEVLAHHVSIDGAVPALDMVADASLNSEVPTHCVSVDGSVDGNVPALQQVHQASPVADRPATLACHINTTSQDHGVDLLSPDVAL
ncbi:hypothetical protein L7F22_028432 [Adiantum nelumboides]|nr:hypothetical protein [Adiantum nelumboides]